MPKSIAKPYRRMTNQQCDKWANYRYREIASRVRNTECTLTLRQQDLRALMTHYCPYTQEELLYTITGDHRHPRSAQIERINPMYGYTHSNTIIVTKNANEIKSNVHPDYFINMANGLREVREKRRNIVDPDPIYPEPRHRTIIVEYNGARYTTPQLARACGINYYTLRRRLRVGLSVDEAVQPGVVRQRRSFWHNGVEYAIKGAIDHILAHVDAADIDHFAPVNKTIREKIAEKLYDGHSIVNCIRWLRRE